MLPVSSLALAAPLLLLLSSPAAAVDEIGPDDFRLSAMGGIGDTAYQARTPAVAYNPDDDEYLVVWAGDTDQPPFGDGLWGIFGQRIDAATGDEVGPDDFAITGVIDGDPGSGLFRPAVAYNPDQGEYLVTWTGNTGLCCGGDYEVYARRVSAAGVPIGAPVQVSQMVDPINTHILDAFNSAVAYNPTAGEYLVVWEGDDMDEGRVDEEFEIFGQRLSATAAEIGTNDFRISGMGPNGSTFYDAREPDVVYNPVDDEYLVVWNADDDAPPHADNEYEVYVQRLDGATGAELGEDDRRITSLGPPGDDNFLVTAPMVAHDPFRDEYLVVFVGAAFAPAPFQWDLEIFGQRLDASGAEIGADDFRLTDIGGDSTAYDAELPDVVFDTATGSYLVAFHADDDVGGQVDGELEIHVQELSGQGVEVGPNDDRVSDMGTLGSFQYQAFAAAIACSAPRGDCLVVWHGDDPGGGQVDHEFEIFGQLLRGAGVFGDGFESGDTSAWSATAP
jgi:hypothetical protein